MILYTSDLMMYSATKLKMATNSFSSLEKADLE